MCSGFVNGGKGIKAIPARISAKTIIFVLLKYWILIFLSDLHDLLLKIFPTSDEDDWRAEMQLGQAMMAWHTVSLFSVQTNMTNVLGTMIDYSETACAARELNEERHNKTKNYSCIWYSACVAAWTENTKKKLQVTENCLLMLHLTNWVSIWHG